MISITKLTMMKAMLAFAYIASTCTVQAIPIDAHQLEKRGYPRPPKASTVIYGSWTLRLTCSSPSFWLSNQRHHSHRDGPWNSPIWLTCSSPSLWLSNQRHHSHRDTAPGPSGSPAPPRPSGSPINGITLTVTDLELAHLAHLLLPVPLALQSTASLSPRVRLLDPPAHSPSAPPSFWLSHKRHHSHRDGPWNSPIGSPAPPRPSGSPINTASLSPTALDPRLTCSSPSSGSPINGITLTATTAPGPSGSPAPPRPSGSPINGITLTVTDPGTRPLAHLLLPVPLALQSTAITLTVSLALWLACSSPSLWLSINNITLTVTAPAPSDSPAPPPSESPIYE
ncbi:hypothetical protein BC829DRAFT_441557 [Chytridium lagenaria]|nr:hypothetical protein BC829DRAFT_441557 [Chytridium lagenaria]